MLAEFDLNVLFSDHRALYLYDFQELNVFECTSFKKVRNSCVVGQYRMYYEFHNHKRLRLSGWLFGVLHLKHEFRKVEKGTLEISGN